jgi:hypothetical protein
MDSIRRLDLRRLALAGGLAYALAVTLVGTQADTDPVGAQYDAFNRVLAAALAIVAVSAATVWTRIGRTGLSGRRPATALVVGFGAMALGSLLEFWGSLIAGKPGSATADRTGEEAFAGADVGFALFGIGTLVALVSALAFASGIRRWPAVTRTTVIAAASLGVLHLAAFGLWTVSPLAAAVPGVLFAFAWLAVVSSAELAAADPLPSQSLAPGSISPLS